MTKPNIVWLMSDHLVYAHHKAQTGYPQLATFDRLAAEGMAFDNAFSVCPLCQPARASMLTGVYPHRHGMTLNDGDTGAKTDHDPDAKLFNHYLQQAGYRTGYFGKWHNGVARVAQDYGFEGFSMPGYGHPYYSDEYAAYLVEMGLPEPEVTLEWAYEGPEWAGQTIKLKDFPRPYESPYFMMESSGVLNTPLETHEAYFLAHLATCWLEEVVQGDAPFFLRFDTWGPHLPFYVTEPFLNTVNPDDIPLYPNHNSTLAHRPAHHRALLDFRQRVGASAHWHSWQDWQRVLARCHEHAALVDAAVGRVVAALERLGVLDNTLILYTTDHGGALASNGGLVDKGWLMTEETVRIPLAARWPGQIAPGSRSEKLVMNMDLVPTVLAAAGAAMPEVMDGACLQPLWEGEETAVSAWRNELMLQHHGHYRESHFQRQLRLDSYKYVAHLDDLDELYDLQADPYELENLVNEPRCAALLADMRRRLHGQMVQFADDGSDAQRLWQQMGVG